MGQTLSEPVTEKYSEQDGDQRVMYGVSSMQGWRISMEDAHATLLNVHDAQGADGQEGGGPGADRLSFFGVYDGHGGDKVAIFTGEHLHEILARQESFKRRDYEQALRDGFLATDRAILSDPKYEDEVSGCTATVALVGDAKIWVANAGDSRTVLGVKGRAKPLSFDHKPQNDGEKARICAAGGFVDFGRVNGNLALSRAIGDFEFKKSADLSPEQQIVTAYPDVIAHEISPDDEFLVLACDGIWDVHSSQAVIEFVRRGVAAKQDLKTICENMMDNSLASSSETGGVGCDNMTIAIVALLNGKTKEEWYDTIAKRVADGDGPCAPPEAAELNGPKGRGHRFAGNEGYGVAPRRMILLGHGGHEVDNDPWETEDSDEAHTEEDSDHGITDMHDDSEAELDSHLQNASDEHRNTREDTPGPESAKPAPPKEPAAINATTSIQSPDSDSKAEETSQKDSLAEA